jgi:hypothetical protein
MNKQLVILGLGTLLAASALNSQAQSYYLAGDFVNGWNSAAGSQMSGGPVYSNTITGGTAGNYQEMKVTDGTWNNSWPGSNLKLKFSASGANTVYFMPGSFSDGWSPAANRVGYDDPGNVAWEVIGDFTSNPGWSSGIALNSIGNGVYSNSISIPTAGTYNFKLRLQGSWDISIGTDFGNSAGNLSVTTTNSPQVVKFRLDLPNGRYLIGDLPPPPVTNSVTFAVDMTSQLQLGKFNPSQDTVFVSGAFNGWPGTNPPALVLTNYPTYGNTGNTNIYYGTANVSGSPSSTTPYKFTCTDPANSGNNGYEPRGSDRTLALLSTNGSLTQPTGIFGDVLTSDFLTADTTVIFSVDMNGAHTTASYSPSNNFDGSQYVFINGNFLDNGWQSSWLGADLYSAGLTMTENPVGSQIYWYTNVVKAGHPVEIHYKYAFSVAGASSDDNEAPAFSDHIRIVRLTSSGTYIMPQDTFGNQRVEPNFGNLTVTPAGGGNVTVSWLGRPGVKLQSVASLTGAWATNSATDGAVWTGTTANTADGPATVTNVPASGSTGFFRLIKTN